MTLKMSNEQAAIIEDNKLITYIKKLENTIKERDVEIFSLNEKIEEKTNELKVYDKFLGYTDEMTLREKKRHNARCEKEEKRNQEIVKDLDQSLREEYEKDLLNEEDIVDLALTQNQLQFEISECFQTIRSNLKSEENYKLYKQYKRDILKVIDGFYSIVTDEFKPKVIDVLIDILDRENQVYDIDERIKKF